MIDYMVYQNSTGFVAMASDGNCGYGDSTDAAIADLQLCYDDADFDVFDFVFEAE